jgi:glutathione S-transferase
MHTFVGLYFSPWTERARWSLDYHQVPYHYREYTTLIDEPWLRWKARKPTGKVSVPLLITDAARINDSFAIAQYADTQSSRSPLVPAAHEEEIRAWMEAAERGLCAARILATRRLTQTPAALAERLPRYVPGPLRRAMSPLGWLGSHYILAKYPVGKSDGAELLAQLDAFLARSAAALANREFVFGAPTFADLVIATTLQAVRPVGKAYIDLGEASAAVMREPELEAKYPALLAWRDWLYARFR